MPAYNEGKRIDSIIRNALKHCHEVIVCDDGSVDNTYQIAKDAGATVIKHTKNRGYGAAIKTLFEAAKEKNADVIVTIDSDGQHEVEQVPELVAPVFDDDCDIVIGSRFLKKSDMEKVPRYRKFGIKTLTKLSHLVSYENLTDTQSGFRAYSRKALEKINLYENGMSISTEILVRAKENNLSVKEVPISVNYDIPKTSTHNSVSHGLGVMTSLLQLISVHHPMLFFGIPGIVLFLISIFYLSTALELFSETRFVSTNMIVISLGSAVVGVILMATGFILYSMSVLLRGRT